MDQQLSWSRSSVEDLQAIVEFISRDSPFYASAVVTKMMAVSRSLSAAPLIDEIADRFG